MRDFVHLHLHTGYSLLDGACRVGDVVQAAADCGMRSLAITDHGSMFGVVDFYKTARKVGIKPIIGCEIYVARDGGMRSREGGRGREGPRHLVLLASNDRGYYNLTQIVTAAHLEGFYYKPRADKSLISKYHKGLIGLSACWKGEVAEYLLNDDIDGAERAASEYADILGAENFFLEVQDHRTEQDRRIIAGMKEVAARTGLDIVATNDVHYLQREHAVAHEVLQCMQTQSVLSDPDRMRMPTHEYWFKTGDDMADTFPDMPEALDNACRISDRCDVELRFGDVHFPAYEVPEKKSARSYLIHLCAEGAKRRYGIDDLSNPQDEQEATIAERYSHEMHVIERTGFVNYYLVVWDFVHFAREQGIPVGLRGSGGASLVAYLVGITDIDPLRYGLVFERFLNPERVSPPDFDIDFCQRRRGEIIEYLREKYGEDRLAHIITFGSLGAKQVIRDVGRVLEVSYGECDRLARMVPDGPGVTLHSALQKNPDLQLEYDTNELCKSIMDFGFVLEGLYRNPGTHAAGVVIGEQPLSDIVPLTRDKEGELVTQYAMEPLSEIGLLKMDVLGLRTLTVIHEALELIASHRNETVDLDAVSMADEATYDLFNRGDTVGVFQLESEGMRELIRRVGIDRVEDLIAMIALYRPGPMNMLDDYVERKTGVTKIKYDHRLLEPILEETHGVMVYQEQVQQAAAALAGYSLGQGDILRRAMGKKDARTMERQRTSFIEGCRKANKIKPKVAGRIFDTLARFAGYGFNKSHSTAYAIVAYRTAYLKANYPAEFMCALLSSEMSDAAKLRQFIDETRGMGLSVQPPDINASGARFQPAGDGIRFGLCGIKNVGTTTVMNIIAEREANGPYKGFLDFCGRQEAQAVNRRVLESLVRCGCFDSLGTARSRLFAGIDFAMSRAVAVQKDRLAGQRSLFESMDEAKPDDDRDLPEAEPWHESDQLAAEKELIGFYVSGHPLSRYASMIKRYRLQEAADICSINHGDAVRLGGIVSGLESKMTRKQELMGLMQVEGLEGAADVIIFPRVYERYAEMLQENMPVFVVGKRLQGDQVRVAADEICSLDEMPLRYAERVSIHAAALHMDEDEVEKIRAVLARHHGPVPVVICMEFPGGEKVFVDADTEYRVAPDEELILELERIVGEHTVYVAIASESIDR